MAFLQGTINDHVDFIKLGNDRQVALKNFFKSKSIDVTRLTWDVRPGVEIPAATADALPPNVTITITGIEPIEEDD